MSKYVALEPRRNRGWPWPEIDSGSNALFGEDGWCSKCGVPKNPQSGPLVLQRKSLRPVGAWMPHWQDEIYCMSADLAAEVDARFDVSLRPVEWRGASPGEAMQLVVPTVGQSWFVEEQLAEKVKSRHGRTGKRCEQCNVWRWLGLFWEQLPKLRTPVELDGLDVGASPEWFGDGTQAYRQVVMRRELAELLCSASPKDFEISEI